MYYNENLRYDDRIIIKINNESKIMEKTVLSNEEISLLKRTLLGNKPHLCPNCNAVCLSDRRNLSGPIFEGISTVNQDHITKCANYRKK